ncbi:hypothetical protein B0H14DRAFT_3637406 [Mycena olivaceomarginata]|nr:hypothetical protein B0H14DRAFT_3637406 [Mycena olivaceomarginata]
MQASRTSVRVFPPKLLFLPMVCHAVVTSAPLDPDRRPAAGGARAAVAVWVIILSTCGGTAQDLATHPVPGRRDGRLDPLDCIWRRARRPCNVRGGSTPYCAGLLRRCALAVHSIDHVTLSGCGVERCG